MKNTVGYNYEKHYDFIKSDEAKDIFLNLEKEKYLKSEQNFEEEVLRKHFSYDEEKKSIVESFMIDCFLCQEHRGNFLKLEQEHENLLKLSHPDFPDLEKAQLVQNLNRKKNIDPEYIYEHWQVEKLRFFDEMYMFFEHKEYESLIDFALDNL